MKLGIDKPATLELIAKANGKKTGDEIVSEREAELKRSGLWLNSKERRRMREMEKKARAMSDECPNP